MHIILYQERCHAAALRAGLEKLGPQFVAELCYWCEGTGYHRYEHCSVCGRGLGYGAALGLLINGQPAPSSVVNQVLVTADVLDTVA